jgi:quercetin dioxygenase-like cupin family protein
VAVVTAHEEPPEPPGGIWTAAEAFHAGVAAIHTPRPGEPAELVQRRADLAHVVYRPAHPNPDAPGWMAGGGRAFSVWIASEQSGTAQGRGDSGPLAVIDTRLEPGAAIGWHEHPDTAELYVLLAGTLHVRAGLDGPSRAHGWTLRAGDCHRLAAGWGHTARAGDSGARFLVVEWRAPRGEA